MNEDPELDQWREQWQSDTVVAPDLRKKVESQSRLMKIGLAGDILVTIVIGGGSILWALRSSEPDAWLVAAAAWLFIAAAWIFVLTATRGTWSPSGLDTAAFVELSIRRCRGRFKTILFAAGLFIAEIAFSLTWVYNHIPQPRQPVFDWLWFSSIAIDIVWIATIAFTGFLFWYHRKKKAEFEWLLKLNQQMTGNGITVESRFARRRFARRKKKREA